MEPEQIVLIPEAIESEEFLTDALGRPLQVPNGGNGRPAGAKNHTKRLYEEELTPLERRQLIRKTYNSAMAGNPYDRRSLLDRIWAKDRSPAVEIELPETNSPADCLKAIHATFAAMKRGEISPDVAASIISTLKDMIAAHGIETLMPGSGETAGGDPRALLLERINRVVEERRRRSLAAAPAEDAA